MPQHTVELCTGAPCGGRAVKGWPGGTPSPGPGSKEADTAGHVFIIWSDITRPVLIPKLVKIISPDLLVNNICYSFVLNEFGSILIVAY